MRGSDRAEAELSCIETRAARGGDRGHFQGLCMSHRGQQSWKASRQHAFPDARWTNHQQRVAACGSNCQRPFRLYLAPNIL
jgi:hypothetical protein